MPGGRSGLKWVAVHCLLGALACLGGTGAPAQPAPVPITRIRWIVHPYCWSMHGLRPPKASKPEVWNALLARELWIGTQYLEIIDRMGPDEALVLYPIGGSRPMVQLVAHARRVLGDRCFVQDRASADDALFREVADPIRRFLDDPAWIERDTWLDNMLTDFGKRPEPPGVRAEMAAEVRSACERIGYDWPGSLLEVAYYQRMIAHDIRQAFAERGLSFDPQTVECVASGEGFEECAMTWKSMVAHYLGLARPIENDYELSVSGAPMLNKAIFKERIALAGDVRLFLWEGEEGRSIALFVRAGARLGDPQLFAEVPLGGPLNLEVRTFSDLFWEGKAHTRIPVGSLYIPVFTATRGGGDDGLFYLVGSGEAYEQFRDRMANVNVGPRKTGE